MSVIEKDLGWNKFIKILTKVNNKSVKVGIQAGDKTADGKHDLAKIAAIHEFGSSDGKIPERSFIRSAIDENDSEIGRFCGQLGAKILDGNITTDNALDLLGQKVTGMIQEQITDGDFTPNAPSTIARKKSEHPLIDTGHMRASVRHVLEKE